MVSVIKGAAHAALWKSTFAGRLRAFVVESWRRVNLKRAFRWEGLADSFRAPDFVGSAVALCTSTNYDQQLCWSVVAS